MDGKKKNVLFLVIDCLRADYVFEEMGHTPNLRRLVNGGFSFTNAIASTTTTTPSFSSMLTGTYPFENGVRTLTGYGIRKGIKTYAEIFKENGYHTYAEVSGPLGPETGLNRGFDEYNYRDRKSTIHTSWGDDFLKRIESHYEEPWFVMLHVWALHGPRQVIDECKVGECGKTLYARSLSSIDKYLGRLLEKVGDDCITVVTGDHGEAIATSFFDRVQKVARGKLLRFMLKYGISKKPYSKAIRNIHLGHGHCLYDELVKVPLVFFGECITPGKSDTQVRHIDIMPTVSELIGVGGVNKISGRSLVPLMNGGKINENIAYMEASGVPVPNNREWIAGLRIDNKYKYIMAPFRDDFEEELYDLEKDPKETTNIASKNMDYVKKLRKMMGDLKTEEMLGEKIEKNDEERAMGRLKELGYL